MSSRITMILAVLFLIGAVLAGYWGLVLSRSTDTPVAAAPPARLLAGHRPGRQAGRGLRV